MFIKQNFIKQQADLFKALGHPSRLLMVHALSDGDKCVCELQTLVGDTMPTISRHLSILKNHGVVSSQKRGLNVYYTLEMTCLKSLLSCTTTFIERQDGKTNTEGQACYCSSTK